MPSDAHPSDLLDGGIQDGVFTHAVYAVAVDGRIVAEGAFGEAAIASVFDIASLTKPLATATLILQLVDEGSLGFDTRLADLFSARVGPLPHLDGITIHHLLTHTSGLPPIPGWPDGISHDEMIAHVLASVPLTPPAVAFRYSDTGYILLGEIAQRLGGEPLARLFADRIAHPLGLARLRYLPPADWPLVPTSSNTAPGIVHDPRARDMGGVAGHAGLFGDIHDVAQCVEKIRLGAGPVVSPDSAFLMAHSQIAPEVGGMSYGWFCAGNAYRPGGDRFSDSAYGHSGFTGTLALVDPERSATIVLLTNRVMCSPDDNAGFLAFRREWLNAVAEMLDG